MNKLFFSKLLMIAAIVFIAAFQTYWLTKLYNDELKGLKKETDVLLRNAVQELQNKSLQLDSSFTTTLPLPRPADDKFREANIAEGHIPKDAGRTRFFKKFSNDTLNFRSSVSIKTSSPHKKTDSGKIVKDVIIDSHFTIHRMPVTMMKDADKIDSLMKLAGKKGSVKIIVNTTGDTTNIPKQIIAALPEINKEHIKKNEKIKDTTVFFDKKGENFIKASVGSSDSLAYEKLKSLVVKLKDLYDSIPVKKVDSVYKIKLYENKIKLSCNLKLYKQKDVKIDTTSKKLTTGYVEIGFNSPYAYKATFDNPFWFIMQQISMPLTVSFLLIILTTLSFLYLYKNLAAQQKLALIKDEFISNITHELKTPIATVNVAIEALKNFDAIQNPEKTKEYLNISSSELQRLSLLVDKVLKLSMFESKAIELNIEPVDIKQLAEEVIGSMQLQAINAHASIKLITEGNYFFAKADRLHITSVLFNLLDNALKYSGQNAAIIMSLQRTDDSLIIAVKDNGIGIEQQYQHKIFDKFFRVPTGGHHNVKGYGLGLSYVAEIIKKHNGTITVDSVKDNGSTFIIQLPLA